MGKKSGFCAGIAAIAACFLTAAALLFSFSDLVKAAQVQSGQTTITVEVVTADDSDQVRVSITAVDSASPSPSPASTQITGSGTADFSLTFDRVGDYEYTVEQEAGSSTILNYDDTVYTVIVSVRNNSTYDGFVITQVVYKDPSQKVDGGIVFSNRESYYLVEHYLEQADGTYLLAKTEMFYAAEGSKVTAAPLTFEHYHENKEHTERIPNGIVLEVPMEEIEEEAPEEEVPEEETQEESAGDETSGEEAQEVHEAESIAAESASYSLTMLSTGTSSQESSAYPAAVAGGTVAVSLGAVKVVSLSTVQQSSSQTAGPLVLKLYYAYDRYTVIYNDGVDGSVVFTDQVRTEIPYGMDTPSYTGTPAREGYVFVGWDKVIADTVTEDAIYKAVWTPVSTNSTTETSSDSGDNGSDSLDGGTEETAAGEEETTSDFLLPQMGGTAQTGDSSRLLLWLAAFVVCGGGLIYARHRQKK
ncbi:MAG: hypothetical protein LUE16_06175 [Lachnospiraceae bacterium]|nr:hypothetical protein [Lachnospiraceae bacterium]